MTKPNSALIVVVLDRSGSMASLQNATVEGFNKFLWDQKQLPGEARMTLVQFDDVYEINYQMARLDDIKLVYEPRGSTALLYAMGRTIDEVGQHLKERRPDLRPDKVIFVTITDGHENYSHYMVGGHRYTKPEVFAKIVHQREKYGWEFVFLGANQDAIAVGAGLGIPSTHSMSYDPSHIGTMSTYGTVSNSISESRTGGSAAITKQARENYNKETGTSVATDTKGGDAS